MPLDDLYVMSVEDPQYQAVLINETKKRAQRGNVEPFLVASTNQDQAMFQYSLKNSPLTDIDIIKESRCNPWITAEMVKIRQNKKLLFESCNTSDVLNALTYPEVLSIYLEDVVRGVYIVDGKYHFINTTKIVENAKSIDDVLRYISSFEKLYRVYPGGFLFGLFNRWNRDVLETTKRFLYMDELRRIEKNPSIWLTDPRTDIELLQEFFNDPQVRNDLAKIQTIMGM